MVIRVQTRENEPVDKALRRLRKLCNNEGLTRTTKAKAYFEKPSERRRREARERLKAIRLACRAKQQDAQKLSNRRRKARKSARLQATRTETEERRPPPRREPEQPTSRAPAARPSPATGGEPTRLTGEGTVRTITPIVRAGSTPTESGES